MLNTNPVEIRTDAPAEVTKSVTLPEADKPKKGKKAVPQERPESMCSDNPDKDQLLDRLWNMMVKEDVTDPMLIQFVCAEKGYYDASVPVNEYDMEFIEGCLIEAWDKVLGLVLTKKEDLPF